MPIRGIGGACAGCEQCRILALLIGKSVPGSTPCDVRHRHCHRCVRILMSGSQANVQQQHSLCSGSYAPHRKADCRLAANVAYTMREVHATDSTHKRSVGVLRPKRSLRIRQAARPVANRFLAGWALLAVTRRLPSCWEGFETTARGARYVT